MKKISFKILLISFIICSSCKENIIESVPSRETTLKFEFSNNQTVFELEDGKSTVQYYLTNISENDIFIPVKVLENGNYFISKTLQHFHNNMWISNHKHQADSFISIKPKATLIDTFNVDEIGVWRTIIPLIDQDSVYSKEIFVIAERGTGIGNGRINLNGSIEGIEIGMDYDTVVGKLGKPDYYGEADLAINNIMLGYITDVNGRLEITLFEDYLIDSTFAVFGIFVRDQYLGSADNGIGMGSTKQDVIRLLNTDANYYVPEEQCEFNTRFYFYFNDQDRIDQIEMVYYRD